MSPVTRLTQQCLENVHGEGRMGMGMGTGMSMGMGMDWAGLDWIGLARLDLLWAGVG